MCLDTVTRLPSHESLLEEVVGWALKAADGESLFAHPTIETTSGPRKRKPARGLAHIVPVPPSSTATSYPSGFHIFQSPDDARDWQERIIAASALIGPGLEQWNIEKVRGKGILAEGLQGFLPVYVVLELERA